MIKKTIKYEDYNGELREEDFYFHLNKAELLEIGLISKNGLENEIKSLIAKGENSKIIDLFKQIIIKAYGVKSEDGKRFIKNKEVKDEFIESEAYSELFIELATNEEAATKFITGIMPKDIDMNEVNKQIALMKDHE